MLVKDWMSHPVITVNEGDSMQDAMSLLKKYSIRMLPVLKNEKLTGVVTDRDLKRASASDATSLEIHELLYLLTKIKVKELMTKNPISVPIDFTVEETAEVLLRHKINGVPVIVNTGITAGTYLIGDFMRAKAFLRDALEIKVWDQNDTDAEKNLATVTANVRVAFRIKNQDAYAFVTFSP